MNSNVFPLNINKQVIKSPNDKNEYYLDILPNGLRYILASNPEIDRSGVGLDVYIGAADDPREYQGLAHCLEHTIFLGSEKYPEASSFDNFLNNNSGSSNANTGLESTNFHYDISNDALEESISMFSEIFKKPLFTKELIDKELNSIENEFKSDFRDDFHRLAQLILLEGYNNSTLNTFIGGNLNTLKKDEIRDKVIELFNNKYDAKIMSLSIFSNKSLEELKNLVVKYFSDIKNIPGFKLENKEILYDKNNMGNLYKIIPIKDYSYIIFFWAINKSYQHLQKSDPIDFVNSVLGHETKYSLTSNLKNKGLIYSLISSCETYFDRFTEFQIKIKLTEEGYNNYNKIISIVLSYINYLQNEEIHEDFFEELKQLSEINFYLDEQIEPVQFCENASNVLNTTKPTDPFYIVSKLEEFKPEIIKEIFNSLTPQNLNIYLLSNKLKSEKEYTENKNLYMIEKIHGTEYMKVKMNFSEYISNIKNFHEFDFGYPELNPFLAKDLSMIDVIKENINLDEYKYPKKMQDNANIIWYKPVIKYKMPKVYFVGKAYISNMNTNLVTFFIYFEIFTKLIAKEISDFNYFGAISENQFAISCSISSVYIKALGYTDSLERYITEYFKIISKLINIEKIENVINKLHKIIDEGINSANNFYIGNVSKQTKTMSEFIIKKLKVMNKKEVYENFRKDLDQNKIPQEFLYFIKNFMKKVKYEWLVEGNILYNDAVKIIKKIEIELNSLFGGINPEINNQHKEPLSINEIRKQKLVNFPSDKIYRYNFSSKDPKNESSTMLVYFQIDDFCFNKKYIFNQQLYEKYIKYFVLNYMMLYIYNETFYDVLRTEQQIGYDVSFSTATYNDVFGLQFYVCSSKYNPDEILERINKFIVDYDINKEQNLTDEKFENYKKALLVDFIEKPLTLDQEASRDLSFIFDRTYKFNQRDDLIKYTNEQLTKKEIIEYFNEYIFKKAKRLEVALYSSVKKEEKEDEIKMDIEENSLPKKEDLKKEDVMEKENNNINKRENYVLPSYQNKEKVIIKDINDFHRQCVYYDTDYY